MFFFSCYKIKFGWIWKYLILRPARLTQRHTDWSFIQETLGKNSKSPIHLKICLFSFYGAPRGSWHEFFRTISFYFCSRQCFFPIILKILSLTFSTSATELVKQLFQIVCWVQNDSCVYLYLHWFQLLTRFVPSQYLLPSVPSSDQTHRPLSLST